MAEITHLRHEGAGSELPAGQIGRALSDDSLNALFVVGDDSELLAFNDAFSDMFGYTRAELEEFGSVRPLVHPDDWDLVRARGDARRRGQNPLTRYQHRFVRKDGSVVVADTRNIAIPWAGGATVVLGEVRDAGKPAAALTASEERLRAIVETARSGLVITTAVGVVDFANHAAAEMLGYELDELIGMASERFIPEDERDTIAARRAARLSGEQAPTHYRSRRVRKSGDEIIVDVAAAVVRIPGEPDGVLTELRDVTEQVVAQREAVKAASETADILEAVPDALIVIDDGGKIMRANFAVFRIFGWLPGELVGRSVAVLAGGADRRMYGGYLPHFLETGGQSTAEGLVLDRTCEIVARRKDGREFPADLRVTEMSSPAGARRFIGSITDITERKSTEEQLRRAQKSEALATLVAGVAHDFNNLLTPILGGIELAQAQPEQAGRWLVSAETAAQQAADLVRQLLKFAKPEEPSREPLDLVQVAREAVSMAQATVDRRIDISLEARGELPPILGDSSELGQVIMNLILNARDAILERIGEGTDELYRPLISVTVNLAGASDEDTWNVVLMVQDNGVGMTQEVRDRAFDPFFTTKEAGKGSGLGLATAFRTVAAHGGALALQSTPGAGTTVTILLPATSEEVALDTGARPDAQRTRRLAGRSVLIVDDEPMALQVASAVLSGAGCDVALASDAKQTLRLTQERPFDLIVLDLNMPGMSGWEVHDRLRTAAPDTRVLIVSGYSSEEDVRQRGAQGFLGKPYSAGQLIEAATRVLDGSPLT